LQGEFASVKLSVNTVLFSSTQPSTTAGSHSIGFQRERFERWACALNGWRDAIALLVLPGAIFLVNPNWPFQDIGSMDPWFYFGGFVHFARYQRLRVNYPAERFMWILPGAILARILTPVYGLLALHLLFYWISVFSMYFLVKSFTDSRTGMLTACLLGCHPLFIGANGWAYVDSASMAYFLLALVFIVKARSSRFPRFWLFLAGSAWASLVYTYILWLSLAPCFVIFYYVAGFDRLDISLRALRERLVPFLVFFLGGAAALTGCLQIIHVAIYGSGRGFFFANNLATALVIIARKSQPNSSGSFQWIWSAGWLVLPALVFLLAMGLLIQHERGVLTLTSPAKASLYGYLYVLAVTVIMTVHGGVRLLEFDYFASILIAPLFLAMGLTIFRIPEDWSNARFYLLLATCCAVCVLPLSRPDLYQVARIHGLAFTYLAGTLMMAVCIVFPGRSLSSVTLLCIFPIVSFALIPIQPGAAWRIKYDGIGLTRRVASAIAAIDRRLPVDAYPVFWIANYNTQYSVDYNAIMCTTLSHILSMKRYPEFDEDRVYRPGTFLILMTENKDVFDAANEKMTNAGMPLSLSSQDRISANGASYWLTYVRVLKRVSPARASRVGPLPRIASAAVGADSWPETVRLGSPIEEVSLVGPTIRRLFRSDMDGDTGWDISSYGRLGGLAFQPDCLAAGDNCGLYSSGDPRDHLASPYVMPPVNSLVFFSIWAKPLQGGDSLRVYVQNQQHDVQSEGRELATRSDGWKLYGEWLNIRDEQGLRLVVAVSTNEAVLLDKAELVEVTNDLPQVGAREKERH
jgi:hypothetical protein